MWEYSPKIAKICIFCINLPKRGIPLKPFLQYIAWKREPQDRTRMPNFTTIALKIWTCGPQNRQKWYFLVKKFAPREKFWGSTGKLEHRCTTTNLPLCNDTITVWKLYCFIAFPLSQTSSFQSVTKKTDRRKKHHTFLSTADQQFRR